jgi:hypothetical protein
MEISLADSVSYRKNAAKNEETPEKCLVVRFDAAAASSARPVAE